jgi:DNA-3-methyladenine glycosylase
LSQKILSRQFYEQPPLLVTKKLLGKNIVRRVETGVMIARIVETEAYIGPRDKASHAYDNRRTKRTLVQWGKRGCAYVFTIYGRNNCFCVVIGRTHVPAVALIRAVEPLQGIELMAKNRNVTSTVNLTNGPSKLTQALGIATELSGTDLCREGDLFIVDGEVGGRAISSARVGVDYAMEYRSVPWRFYVANNIFVSKRQQDNRETPQTRE